MRKMILPVVLVGILLLGGMVMAFTSAPAYAIRWYVIGGGGGAVQSTHYRLGGTIGQPVTGESSSAHYRLGAGYWYGMVGVGPVPTPAFRINLPAIMKNLTP
ncbi:MAG: hypothetical protein ACUVR2_11815 [Anaerolineae bacterium]